MVERGTALPRLPTIQLIKELLLVLKGLLSPDNTPNKLFAKIWSHLGWFYGGSGVMALMVVTHDDTQAKQFSGGPDNKSSGSTAHS